MSTISEHVSLTITQDTVSVARSGFGTPMILSVNASFPERLRFYSDLTSVADDFDTTSPEYLAARALLSQSPHPELISIGRAVGQPTQRYQINITSVGEGYEYVITADGEGVTGEEVSYTALADITFVDGDIVVGDDTIAYTAHGMSTGDGPFRLSNAGGALPTGTGIAVDTNVWIIAESADLFKLATSRANALALTDIDITAAAGTGTHTLRRAQNDVICAQLVQALNDVVDKNFTAAQTPGALETDYIVVTADAAGDWFSLTVDNVSLMKIEQTHAEPGTTLATDLDAINLENDAWYALYTLYNSDGYVKAAADWIESVKKIYIADLSNSETATLANGGGDTADDIQTSAYSRTAVLYHPNPSEMAGAAWLGTRLPYDPGSETWKFASPSAVDPVTTTSTHRVNLRAKAANTLQTVGGRNIFWEGTMADGGFIDTVRGLDWLEDDMLAGVFGALASATKIPYTNAGVALIVNEIRASLERAIDAGILSDDPKPTVTAPLVADIADADKGVRLLPDVKFTCTLAGAVHKVQIIGVVSL
jgi:hypothetical protein